MNGLVESPLDFLKMGFCCQDRKLDLAPLFDDNRWCDDLCSDAAQVEVEELVHAFVENGTFEAVATVGYFLEQGRDTGFLQSGVDLLALGKRDEWVFVAVGGEERGVAFGDMSHRGGFFGSGFALLNGAAEQKGFGVVVAFGAVHGAGLPDHGEEVFRAEIVDHARDLAVLIEMLA